MVDKGSHRTIDARPQNTSGRGALLVEDSPLNGFLNKRGAPPFAWAFAVPPILLLVGGLGMGEILFIIFVIMLLFGAQKIPELARALGKAQREFEKARKEVEKEAATPGVGAKEHPVNPPTSPRIVAENQGEGTRLDQAKARLDGVSPVAVVKR